VTQALDAPEATTPAPPPRHPLAPLTAAEIEAACAAVVASRRVAAGVRFVYCTLAEPLKADVLGWDGTSVPRLVTCVTYDKAARLVQWVTVSLDEGAVVDVTDVPGAQAPILLEEWVANADAIKADPRWQAAMARRGITDTSLVQIDPWPASNFALEIDETGRRIGRGVAYVLDAKGDNAYARPVENLVAIVDRDTGEVLEIDDGDVVPVPEGNGRYDEASVGPVRTLAPLEIHQPEGSGVTVDDGQVAWGPWRLRVSMHPMEGLVIHEVCHEDGDRLRPVVYRASMSEMIVPYGSTATNHWWKNAFDAGDIGLGKLANSLTLGCDCLGEITYLDSVSCDENGSAVTTTQAICIHEEDYGILWKHVDMLAGQTEVRRSRRLVVSFIATVGNYEYGFYWYFYLDGSLGAEVKLTGIIQTQAVEPGARVPYANPVTPTLAGPHHQHLFNFRLDMCVDGPENSVVEVDAVPVPAGPDNPWGNAFTASETLLTRESKAQRLAAPERSRYWKVVNRGSTNAVGEPVAYKLIPTTVGAPLLAQPEAAITGRATFATRHLWVTPFAADERRAAGDFPNQHPGGDGLPRWTAADRPLVDADLVAWLTLGTTHFVRPEDWPVMPCEYVGFMLKPAGFFDRNPGIDLAATTGGDHCHT
jgi:primary-amine oxidase